MHTTHSNTQHKNESSTHILTSRRTYRQSHGTLGVLNEWPSCRLTAASGSRITAIHAVVMS